MFEQWARKLGLLLDATRNHARKFSPQIGAALRWIAEPAAVIVLVLASTTAFAQPFYVPTGSMEPTIAIGDAVIATKFPYGYSTYSVPFDNMKPAPTRLFGSLPARGDIVIFRLPREPGVNYVKRVIGLPGDHIQMKEGRLWINGSELPLRADGSGEEEDSNGNIANVPRYIETLPGGREHVIYKWTWSGPLDDTDVYLVPQGYLFMMGDNRDDSTDSRVAATSNGVGFVPLSNLVGRAEFVIGSYDFLNAEPISGWVSALRLSRFFRGVH